MATEMEEVERRFSGTLVLSERESKGLRIGGIAARSALKYQFAVVCKVLTDGNFRRQSFIDLFSRLWGGEKGVAISDVEDDRFLACFQSEGDMRKVLNREPWDFDKSLIVMAPMGTARSVTDVRLNSAVFWVQAHGVPWKFRTPEVAADIGGILGDYLEAKADENGCCVGRCVCIRVRLDITLALLRRTVVNFPEFGDQLIEFQYERLPEFCQECGLIGHPTRVCFEKLGIKGKPESERPFSLKLRADKDVHGRRIGYRVGRSSLGAAYSDGEVSGDGTLSKSGWSTELSKRSRSGGSSHISKTLQIEEICQDTASSPVKALPPNPKSKSVLITESFSTRKRSSSVGDVMVNGTPMLEEVVRDVTDVVRAESKPPSMQMQIPPTLSLGNCDAVRRLGSAFRQAFGSSTEFGESGPIVLSAFGGVEKSPKTSLEFSLGVNRKSPVGKKNLKGRRMVSITARRKLQMESVNTVSESEVDGGKRKLEVNIFNGDERQNKKVILSSGIPEVVGAAGLPHHEQ